MKTVICGPPHSGKSVFIANLSNKLPPDAVLIRAAPDGEGTWSNNKDQDNVQQTRQKGKFSKEFIDKSCEKIDAQPHNIITLVDVGGMRSDENAQVFSHCDSFIILSSDPEETKKWREFGENLGLKCIASIDSKLEGKESIDISEKEYIEGTIVGLERGHYIESELLTEICSELKYLRNKNLDITEREANPDSILLSNSYLMQRLNKEGENYRWTPQDLSEVSDALKDVLDTDIAIYGIKANFLTAMAAGQLAMQGCHINLFDVSNRRYEPLQELATSDERENEILSYTIKENEDSILLEVKSKQDFIDKGAFDSQKLPNIDPNKKLYISGRLPHWALAEIIITYDNNNINVFQPGNGMINVRGDLGKIIDTKEWENIVQTMKEEKQMTTIKLSELAEKIGNAPQEVTLPNGQTRMSVNWDAKTAQDAIKEVYPLSQTGEKVVIDGPAPGWFVSSLAHAVHPCPVGLNDPKVGVIDVPQLQHGEINPAGEISFKVEEGESFVKLEWAIDNGTVPPVYDAENLKNIVVPELPEGKEVCISGRGPNYVTVAIGEAYAHTNKAVSYFQPQTQGYTVGITHTKERSIGDLIPAEKVMQDIEAFQKQEKNADSPLLDDAEEILGDSDQSGAFDEPELASDKEKEREINEKDIK